MPKYVVSTFYKFVNINNFEDLKNPLLEVMQKNEILGTILLAEEGINGTFAATKENSEFIYQHIQSDPRLQDIIFKKTYCDLMPFEKPKVKLKNEIVSMGVSEVCAAQITGIKVAPEDWNELISDPEILVIDTRNEYEVELGTFKNAINPDTDSFRDFPEYVQKHLLDKKDKKIAMFCTGGIRCEKSTSYLKTLGFNEVYQLEGGILNYFEKIPKENSLWEGSCFVFDDRVTISHT